MNINAKTRNDLRPIDIAVIYGSWDIYKFLVDNGATFTANTIIACCSDDRYECINSWTKRIRTLCSCEKPSAKTKKRILIDLYERYISAFIVFLHINITSKLVFNQLTELLYERLYKRIYLLLHTQSILKINHRNNVMKNII